MVKGTTSRQQVLDYNRRKCTGNNDRIKLYAFDFDSGSNQQKTGGIEINNDRAGSDFSTTGTCVAEVKNALEVTGITGADNENSYNGNFEEYGSIVVGGRNAITTYNNVTIGVDNTNSAKDSLIVGHDNSVSQNNIVLGEQNDMGLNTTGLRNSLVVGFSNEYKAN